MVLLCRLWVWVCVWGFGFGFGCVDGSGLGFAFMIVWPSGVSLVSGWFWLAVVEFVINCYFLWVCLLCEVRFGIYLVVYGCCAFVVIMFVRLWF